MSHDRLVELYRAYGGAVYARCRRILSDPQSAEDAAQETFIRVHRHLANAPGPEQALRWIYRIATNYCLNEVRNRKLRPQLVEKIPEPPRDAAADPLVDKALVRWLVFRVPEKVRTVAWLYHVDGLEQAELAELLGISRRTVVNRLAEFQARARKLLAEK